MIDFVLHSPSGAGHLKTWASSYPPANPLLFKFETASETIYVPRRGFSYVLWRSNGKFMTQAGSYDGETEMSPPQYLPGVVALTRIHADFFNSTKIASFDPSSAEQWQRNTVAKYIKDNGTLGNVQSIPYYEYDGVRVFRPQDVLNFIQTNSLVRHEWLGGNAF
jgi:hypothetical protein